MIPYGSRVGRGIVLGYMPAGNAGGFAGVSKDTGIRPAGTAADRIADVVAIKAQKVQKGLRAQAFSRWWLVLDEEIVFFHPILGREWTYVEDCVRSCEGVEQWNKVVLYSRFTGSWRTIHEHGGEPALPCLRAKTRVPPPAARMALLWAAGISYPRVRAASVHFLSLRR